VEPKEEEEEEDTIINTHRDTIKEKKFTWYHAHNIIQIRNNVMWDWQHSTEYFHIQVEYCQSHITLLWSWIMLCMYCYYIYCITWCYCIVQGVVYAFDYKPQFTTCHFQVRQDPIRSKLYQLSWLLVTVLKCKPVHILNCWFK
jgi:hypothetical protein